MISSINLLKYEIKSKSLFPTLYLKAVWWYKPIKTSKKCTVKKRLNEK